jgi:putative addiction module component (TIGR02574 family)
MNELEKILQKLTDNLPRLAIAEEKLREAIEFVRKLDRTKNFLTAEQKIEIDRRLQIYQQNPNDVTSWEEIKKRFL